MGVPDPFFHIKGKPAGDEGVQLPDDAHAGHHRTPEKSSFHRRRARFFRYGSKNHGRIGGLDGQTAKNKIKSGVFF